MRRLSSIVRLTLANAIRMKVAIVIIVFLAILIPSLPFILKTDDTQQGHVQITITYGLGMVFLLLVVMTVFIGAASITSEAEGGQLQLLDTKPVRRWQIILGKWLGIMALNVVLLVVLGGVTYGLAKFIGRPSKGTKQEQMKLRNSVFTARETRKPIPPDIEDRVNKEYEKRKREDRLPEHLKDEKEFKEFQRDLELRRLGVVPSDSTKWWEFEGIKVDRADTDGFIYLRYKARTTESREDNMFVGAWAVGDISSGKQRYFIRRPETETVGSPHEFAVPSKHVQEDGTVEVAFRNLTRSDDNRGINVVFNPDEGLELLYKRTGFLSNYIRYLLLVTTILGFVAMLSVVSSSFLSFPVASLLVFSILMTSYGLGTLKEYAYMNDPRGYTSMEKARMGVAKVAYKVASHVLPSLSRYGALGKLNSGRYVSLGLVLRGALVLVVLSGGVVYVLGCIIFSREELG